ncbi:MAG: class I SAM-dependent methyltransferase [Steroidobacteraceae bacterium]
MVAKHGHWDAVYEKKATTDVSWYEPHPQKSLELIRRAGIELIDPIIDVGGGASFLVDDLIEAGYRDLTVLDISAAVLDKLRERLRSKTSQVILLHRDVTVFESERRFALWHDRAVFHFLIERAERERYLEALHRALRPLGHLVIATFGPSGPERCSGLPTMRYDEAALAAELGSDFKLIECSRLIHRTPWNAPQQFLYCRFVRQPRAVRRRPMSERLTLRALGRMAAPDAEQNLPKAALAQRIVSSPTH